MPSQDSLKQRIHKGEVVIGVSAPITADRQRLEDILSRDSYDFVSVDSQHAAFNEEKLVQFCAIAEELDIPVAEQEFANSILYKPDETLGQVAMAALHEIKARVPLDFYGIDFDVLPDGSLVFFEANAAMSVGVGGGKRKGVEPIRARMREALHRLFVQAANRAPPSIG